MATMKQILADSPDWIDDPEHKGAPGPYNMPKRLYRPKTKKKDPKKTKKTKKDHAFGLDPSKDKFVRIPEGDATAYVRKRVTSKPSRHGSGTHGAVRRSSDIKWGKRKPSDNSSS